MKVLILVYYIDTEIFFFFPLALSNYLALMIGYLMEIKWSDIISTMNILIVFDE